MIPLLPAIGIGAALGLGKHFLIDKPKEERKRRLAAATQRYSPWTHLTAEAPEETDPMTGMLNWGATGASIGSGLNQQEMNQGMADAQMKNLDAMTNFYTSRTPQMNFGTVADPSTASSMGMPQDSYARFYQDYINSYDNRGQLNQFDRYAART